MTTAIENLQLVQALNNRLGEGDKGQTLLATEPWQAPPFIDRRESSPAVGSHSVSLPIANERLTAPPVGVDRCIHDLIEEQASQQPEAPAVCSWDGSLTYRSLQRTSSKLAHHLRTLGAGPEKIIPFCFEKSLWAVVAAVAILKSGSAFVALDPFNPQKRRASIIQETGATILVTSPSQAGLFETIAGVVVVISSAFIDSLEVNDSKPCPEVGPRNAAFVLFTSGSTGQPKGIVQDHGAVCTMCSSYGNALQLDARCRVLQFASYNFDVSIVDIVDTLIHGACLCIPSEHDRRHNIVDAMNAMRVTWADLTPSFAGTFNPEDVPTLQTLVLAGEEVQQAHIELWAGKVRLIDCYGPAESSACTAYEYSHPSDQPGTIGYPMTHANCWVVDVDSPDLLASPESVGELVVESPALARGYLNSPEKTKASFIHDPKWLRTCGTVTGRRVYKTGDLVRYQSNGSLKFIGRKDNQVKLRGQRVELSEVEHLLSKYPAISKCIIAYPKSGHCSRRLVAVVQLRAVSRLVVDDDLRLLSQKELLKTDFDTSKAIEYLGKCLPAYMIPITWVTVESIPLTSSKKTDRRRVEKWLEEVMQTQLFDHMGSSNLFTPHELDPQEIFASRLSTIVAEDNAQLRKVLEGHDFALSVVGIDSIQVISLSKRIEQEFNVKIGIERLTNHDTTIRSLAAEVESLKGNSSGKEPTAPIDASKEVTTLFETLISASTLQLETPSVDPPPVENVFLTGATGFLGTQILHQLLLQPSIKRIILHVRTDVAEKGLEQIITAAKTAKWWSKPFTTKLEIWLGDLTKPRLGISSQQWQRLSGLASPEENVHAIIHNGGVVRWNADYYTLKPANTLSTHELLQAVSSCPHGIRFVYVSGGQRLSFSEEEETDEALLAQVRGSNGYAQSKLASELIVTRFASSPHNTRHRISVVKPSYIIGTVTEGLANPTDYLWRLVAGAIDIGAYNTDDVDDWLFVSDVAHVARTIVHNAAATPPASSDNDDEIQQPGRRTITNTTRILDGLPLSDFWHILIADFGYDLCGVKSTEWWSRMRKNVEEKGPTHCLWPLSYMLEEGKGGIGSAAPTTARGSLHDESSERVKAAVRMNVKHLQGIGFLPVAAERDKSHDVRREVGESSVEAVGGK